MLKKQVKALAVIELNFIINGADSPTHGLPACSPNGLNSMSKSKSKINLI